MTHQEKVWRIFKISVVLYLLCAALTSPAKANPEGHRVYLPVLSDCSSSFIAPAQLPAKLSCYNLSSDPRLFVTMTNTGAAYAVRSHEDGLITHLYLSDPMNTDMIPFLKDAINEPIVSRVYRETVNPSGEALRESGWLAQFRPAVQTFPGTNPDDLGLQKFPYAVASQQVEEGGAKARFHDSEQAYILRAFDTQLIQTPKE